jgi:hypothetical protein
VPFIAPVRSIRPIVPADRGRLPVLLENELLLSGVNQLPGSQWFAQCEIVMGTCVWALNTLVAAPLSTGKVTLTSVSLLRDQAILTWPGSRRPAEAIGVEYEDPQIGRVRGLDARQGRAASFPALLRQLAVR